MAAATVAKDMLKSIVERIERLEEEKKALSDDVREVYAEAKGNGFDTKVLRKVIALRKLDKTERQEQEALLDLYMHTLGMTPLEDAIAKSVEKMQEAVGEGGEMTITAGDTSVTLPGKKKRPRSPAAEFAQDLAQ
jgi:uncharacterized protein (UPF0335 family)